MSLIIEQSNSENPSMELAELHPVLQRIYHARGIKNRFDLKTDLASLLPDQDLKNIDQAVALLYDALLTQKHIMIVGDFDADGATSTAIAKLALQSFGFKKVDYIVPNRFDYGYGLTPEIVDLAATFKPDLIITVDNGISSIEGVEHAKDLGINVLITDHHLAAEVLPAAIIVNPNQPEDKFASKHLAGCGVVFYLMLAFRRFLREQNYFMQAQIKEPNMAELLDLVALGTVADLVQLDKNNRILVAQGLLRIRAGRVRAGIKAMLDLAGHPLEKTCSTDLGFIVGPRLNAAGRLEDMSIGIACLLSENYDEAYKLAEKLQALNNERKLIEAEIRDQAFEILDKIKFDQKDLPAGICLFDPSWHQGVVGIVAARVKEKYHRPTIVFAEADAHTLKGSARSIKSLHIRDCLDKIAKQYPSLLTKFGGHAMAAGLTLAKSEWLNFQKIFAEQVEKELSTEALEERIVSDGELSLDDLSLKFAKLLAGAGPWGQGFAEPIFNGVFDVVDQRLVGTRHLKLILSKEGNLFNAIAFNVDLTCWPNYRAKSIELVYQLDINEFNQLQSLQLLVRHLAIKS